MGNPRFRKPFERLSNIDEVKVIQVVMVRSLVGEGDVKGSPIRHIVEFFSTDGELLARRDSYKDGALEAGIWSSDAAVTGLVETEPLANTDIAKKPWVQLGKDKV